MVMKDTRNRKEAEISNVNRPTNPLFPFDKAMYRKLKSIRADGDDEGIREGIVRKIIEYIN
jgi:hypothetical protein